MRYLSLHFKIVNTFHLYNKLQIRNIIKYKYNLF